MSGIAPLVESWLREMRLGRGASDKTAIAYRNDLSDFARFYQSYRGEALTRGQLAKIDNRDVRAFLSDLQKNGLSATSRNRKLSALKSFFRYLETINDIRNEAVLMARGPKKPARLPRPLTMAEADEAIAKAGQVDKRAWVQARDIALVTLLYATGLRVSEALSVTLGDTPLGDALRIRGKGGKVRMVPVLPVVRAAVADYLERLPYELVADDPIFRGIRGGVLSARQAATLMEQIRNRLGLPPSATPHALRHSFASHLLSAGGDIRAIQELLGHASLSATQVYTKLDEAQLLDVYRAAHPRGKD